MTSKWAFLARLLRKGRSWKGKVIRERLLLSTASWGPPEGEVSRAIGGKRAEEEEENREDSDGREWGQQVRAIGQTGPHIGV